MRLLDFLLTAIGRVLRDYSFGYDPKEQQYYLELRFQEERPLWMASKECHPVKFALKGEQVQDIGRRLQLVLAVPDEDEQTEEEAKRTLMLDPAAPIWNIPKANGPMMYHYPTKQFVFIERVDETGAVLFSDMESRGATGRFIWRAKAEEFLYVRPATLDDLKEQKPIQLETWRIKDVGMQNTDTGLKGGASEKD